MRIAGVTSDELIDSQTHLIGVRPKAVGDPRPRRNQTSPPVRPVHVRLTTTDTPEQR